MMYCRNHTELHNNTTSYDNTAYTHIANIFPQIIKNYENDSKYLKRNIHISMHFGPYSIILP